MPLSSTEIASINGVYMQQGMLAQQNAGMIGSLGAPPGMGPSFGEHVMGRAVNTGTAIGGPVAAGMLGLAGMDPVSLALKGGSMGFRAGGLSGGLAMGALGAGASLGAGMVASYAVDQMVQGIQQQQQLTSQLQSSFRFQNPYGTTGFTGTQSRMIGSQLSTMQGFAPGGGPMVGFDELSRLASNMGSMGMAGGVRDVKEFTTRFKEMLTSVKTIAHDMQTSLEEAQKLMSDMRGAGVFGPGRAASFAQQIRATAVAAGVSQAEVTGMMGVGSQISRMNGGLGRQGARAGIEALANVGSATQVGAINEESIYNVTGLTGAEGRRAFATRMMEQSSKFLRGTQGRYFLASVAGSGGHLNESAVENWMAGGVSVDDTRRMANQNLARVGRADFIRNEGRLRSEVQARFGGLETVQAMSSWLESKGVSMDDPRARLYLQRARGMGRDEADAMIQMAQNMPQILDQRKESFRADEMSRKIAESRSHVGIEGLKRKLEDARNSIQTPLAELGRTLFQNASDTINDFIGNLTGEFYSVQHRNLGELTRAAKGLGAGASAARQQLTGGIGQTAAMKALTGGGGFGTGFSKLENFLRDDAGRFDAAGFGISTEKKIVDGHHITRTVSEGTLNERLRNVAQIGKGAQLGMEDNDTSKAGMKLGSSIAGQLQMQAALRGTGQGFDAITNFESTLRSAAAGGSKEAKMTLDHWSKLSSKQKAQYVTSAYRGAGMDVSSMLTAPEQAELTGLRKGTPHAFQERIGEGLLGTASTTDSILSKLGGGTRKALAGAIGAVMDTDEYESLGKRMLATDESVRASARKDLAAEMAGLQPGVEKGTASLEEKARHQALGGLYASQAMEDAMKKAGVKRMEDLPPAEMAKLVKQFEKMGVTNRTDLMNMVKTTAKFLGFADQEQYKQWASGIVESSKGRMDSLKRSGILDEKGGYTAAGKAAFEKLKGPASELFRLSMSSMRAGLGAGEDREAGSSYLGTEGDITKRISEMSVAQMRDAEQQLAGTNPEMARMIRAERSGRQRLEMGRARGGQAGGLKMVAGMLGENVSREDLVGAMRGGGKGIGALAESLVEGSGVTSTDSKKQLSDALQGYLKGEKGGAGKLQGLIEGNQEIGEAKRKRSLSEAEDQNPLQAAANKSLVAIDKKLEDLKYLKSISTSTSDTAELTRRGKEPPTG